MKTQMLLAPEKYSDGVLSKWTNIGKWNQAISGILNNRIILNIKKRKK
jgi:hypothetical protein